MKTTYLIIMAALLFSLTGFSQDTGSKQKSYGVHQKKHKKHKKHYARVNAVKKPATTDGQPPKVTGISNSGSSNGTTASNNDPGKITTSDKGKTGSSNSVVKKVKKK